MFFAGDSRIDRKFLFLFCIVWTVMLSSTLEMGDKPTLQVSDRERQPL